MQLPAILASGMFLPENIHISIMEEKSNRIIDPKLERATEAAWLIRKQAAEERGVAVWDSKTYRLESVEQIGDALHLQLGYIDYRIRASMRNVPEAYTMPDKYWPKGIFVTSIIKTADNFYIFGELSGKTIVDKTHDTIGGVLTPEEGTVLNGSDLFNALYRELDEEINIEPKNIAKCLIRGVMLTDFLNVGVLFETQLHITRPAVELRFQEKNDGELKQLTFVAADQAGEFLSEIKHFGTAAAEIVQL